MSLLINSLNANQINSNFTLKCIDQVNTSLQTQINGLDNETFVDDANNLYISSTSSTTYDPAGTYLNSIGTNNTINNNSSTAILIGNNSSNQYTESSILLGGDSGILGTVTNQSTSIINLGHGSTIQNVPDATPMNYITNIGNGNDLNSGSNIVTIGHDLNTGGGLNNNVIISTNPLDVTGGKNPTAGSIILQTSASSVANQGGRPSAQPRVNFLGNELLNPRGQNAGDVLDGLTTFALPAINGYIRMKYKGTPVLIPIIVDSEGDANVGDPTNITEFPA